MARGGALAAALALAVALAAPAALAQPICPKTVSTSTCTGLKVQLDCIKAYAVAVTTPFTIKLDCDYGGALDCTGVTLDVAGNVQLRPGRLCTLARRPAISVASGDAVNSTLFVVGGPAHAALSVRGVDIRLNGARGGIAALNAASVTLTSVTVTGGAGTTVDGVQRGGALYARNTRVSLTGTTLTGCSAAMGGAIYWELDSASFTFPTVAAPLVVATSRLEGNSASGDGGALFAATARRDERAAVSLRGATATGNTAGGSGGALYLRDARATVATSTLTGNRAALGGAAAALTTGAYVSNAQAPVLLVSSSTLRDNSARVGGAVHLNGTRAQFTGSTCSRNSAEEAGGCLLATSDGSDSSNLVRIGTSRVEGNQALTYGGGLALLQVRAELATSSLVENSASKSGGGLYMATGAAFDNALLAVTGSTLRRNQAGEDGGGAYVASTNPASNPTASLSVATTTISDNTAAGSGGGAFLRDVRADITGGYMSGNSAGISTNSSGGALHFRASAGYAYAATTLAMSKVTLNANLAGAGGAIFLLKESRNRVGIACLGCTLTDNRVPGVGAGSAVATLDRGGEQLTVDLTDSKWAGVNRDAAVCGRAEPLPMTAASVRAASATLLSSCSATGQQYCNQFCLSIL